MSRRQHFSLGPIFSMSVDKMLYCVLTERKTCSIKLFTDLLLLLYCVRLSHNVFVFGFAHYSPAIILKADWQRTHTHTIELGHVCPFGAGKESGPHSQTQHRTNNKYKSKAHTYHMYNIRIQNGFRTDWRMMLTVNAWANI